MISGSSESKIKELRQATLVQVDNEFRGLGRIFMDDLEGENGHFAFVICMVLALGIEVDEVIQLLLGRHPYLRLDRDGRVDLMVNRILVYPGDKKPKESIAVKLSFPEPVRRVVQADKESDKTTNRWNRNPRSFKRFLRKYVNECEERAGRKISRRMVSEAFRIVLEYRCADPVLKHVFRGGLSKNYPVICHYVRLSVGRVREVHEGIVRYLFGDEAGYDAFVEQGSELLIRAEFLTQEQLREFVSALRRLPETGCRDLATVVRLYNRFTVYTVNMLMFATGSRPIAGAFSNLTWLNVKKGMVILDDKHIDDAHAIRLVNLPERALHQIVNHRKMAGAVSGWLEAHASTVTGKEKSRYRKLAYELKLMSRGVKSRLHSFFLIDEKRLVPKEIRPGALIGDDEGIPLNMARKWFATCLYEKQIPVRFIEALLGHYGDRYHGMGATCCLSPIMVMDTCADIIDEELGKIGYEPLPSPLKKRATVRKPDERHRRMPSSEAVRKARRIATEGAIRKYIAGLLEQANFESLSANERHEKIEEIRQEVMLRAETAGWRKKTCRKILKQEWVRLAETMGFTPHKLKVCHIPTERSPFTRSDIRWYDTAMILRKEFRKYLSRSYARTPEPETRRRIAEILISAAIFGNLASTGRLRSLAQCVSRNAYVTKGVVHYINIDTGDSGVYRWYPDPVSENLIVGLLKMPVQEVDMDTIAKEIKQLIKQIIGREWKHPVNRLAQASMAYMKMETPMWVAMLAGARGCDSSTEIMQG